MADSGSSKPSTTTTVQNSAPWAPTQPGLTQGVNDVTSLYNSGAFNIPYYPGQTVASTSPLQSQSWDQTSATAANPATGPGAAQTYNNALLSGDDSSLTSLIKQATDTAAGNFEAAGRYGSGAFGKGVGTAAGQVIAGAEGQAAGQAPALTAASYIAPQALDTAGQEQQGQAQNQINAAVQQYNYQQGEPISAAEQYMQALSGNWGGTTTGTQTQPYYYPSTLSQGVGTAASLGGLASSLYGLL